MFSLLIDLRGPNLNYVLAAVFIEPPYLNSIKSNLLYDRRFERELNKKYFIVEMCLVPGTICHRYYVSEILIREKELFITILM